MPTIKILGKETAYYKERIKNCLDLGLFLFIPYWERKLKQAQEDSMDKIAEILDCTKGFMDE